MNEPAAAECVHAPLGRWARERGGAVAIDDGHERVSFEQLHARVLEVSRRLAATDAPGTVWVEAAGSPLPAVIEFLGIIASGRCAAVADAQWTAATRAAARQLLSSQAGSVRDAQPQSPFYVGFTSGSTGVPTRQGRWSSNSRRLGVMERPTWS